MSQFDREKWNQKYSDPKMVPEEPAESIVRLARFMSTSGRALDLAGGAGRHSIWLAKRGFDVTLADVSSIGLHLARQRAAAAGVTIELCEIDFEPNYGDENGLLPDGPWDLIVSHYYCCRALIPKVNEHMRPGGVLVVVQPTVRNLERNPKPPKPFLLDEGELRTLVAGMEIVHYQEGWTAEDRHEAAVVARLAK